MNRGFFSITVVLAAVVAAPVSAQSISLIPCEGSRSRLGLMAGVSGDSERHLGVALDAAASIEFGVAEGIGVRVDAARFESTLGRDYQGGEPTRYDDVGLRSVGALLVRTLSGWCEDRWRGYWGVGFGSYRYRFDSEAIRRHGLRGLVGGEIATSSHISLSGELGLDMVRAPDNYPYTLFLPSARFGVKIRF